MALTAYMEIVSQQQGDIVGPGSGGLGRDGLIPVIGVNHDVTTQVEPPSGGVIGKMVHGALTITKNVDISSVALRQAQTRNESLSSVEIRFFQPSRSGEEINHFTVKLGDVFISAVRLEMLNNSYPENLQLQEREQVAFVYQRIEWIHEVASQTVSADVSGRI